jgi:hypothetical protein
MPKLKPFRVGEVVQWNRPSAYTYDGNIVDVNHEEATVVAVRPHSGAESGFVVDVEWRNQLLSGYDSGWFKKTKRTTLKTYFNA